MAALWPARLSGPLDGAPLDSPADALVIGLALPLLIAIDRRVLARPAIRALIVVLLAWKAVLAVAVVQDGWCVRFTSPTPIFVNQERVPHAWDVRADWRSDVPRCSAVMTRSYSSIDRFPVWFYNLPPTNFLQPAKETERPPYVTLAIEVHGYLETDADGIFRVGAGDDVALSATVDGAYVSEAALSNGVSLAAGIHDITLAGTLTGERWALMPQWNGADVWRGETTTMMSPGAIDRALRPWARWITAMLIGALVMLALGRVLQQVGDPVPIIAATALGAIAIAATSRPMLSRWVPLAFSLPGWLRMPRRLQNVRGAQLFIGVPFLILIAARGFDEIGRTTWYTSGDDWWVFQRFAYRIYMQGYWLEGGEPVFWFQPFYRWIAGALHMVFGDSSVGELFWDGGCAWAGALFAFHVTRAVANFRWGMAAAVLTLLLMTVGPGWYLFGRGLSELTSAGLIYTAALLALRGRQSPRFIVIAGMCAAIAFYTRLNNLPFAAAVVVFSLPVRVEAGDWLRWRFWWAKCSRPALAGLVVAMVGAVALFGLRTYHYTGSVNALSGTQASARSVWQPSDAGETTIENVIGSVLIVLTMNDPARLDPRALPIVIGVAAAILALARVARFRRLPLNATIFCLAGLAGAFVARGSAYPGRFSIHLIPVTVALTMCSVALWTGQARESRARGNHA